VYEPRQRKICWIVIDFFNDPIRTPVDDSKSELSRCVGKAVSAEGALAPRVRRRRHLEETPLQSL